MARPIGTAAEAAGPNWLLPAVALALLAGFAVPYIFAPGLYFLVMKYLAFGAWHYPFIDAEAVVGQISSWHKGIDVYTFNPGIYSPLWLLIPALPTGPGWTNVYGLGSDLVFIAALAGLPRARRRSGSWTMALAVMSPLVMFAVERANVDVLMFAAAVVVILSAERSFLVRLAGYAVAVAAGLLKFYPLVLVALVVRERRSRFLFIAFAVGLALIAFAWVYWHELGTILRHLPRPDIFNNHDGLGARRLAGGLTDMAYHTIGVEIPTAVATVVLFAGIVRIAFAVAFRPTFMDVLQGLRPREVNCLIGGSLLICGCFFAGNNIGYRAVYLLLVLPGLLAAGNIAIDRRATRLWNTTTAAVVVVLWILPVEQIVADHFGWFHSPAGVLATSSVSILFWLVREAIWWFIMTVLLAVIIRFVGTSTAWQQLCPVAFERLSLAWRGRVHTSAKQSDRPEIASAPTDSAGPKAI